MTGRITWYDHSDLEEKPIPKVLSRPVSLPGVVVGIVFFVFSLLPSLLPRSGVIQGVISGISMMVGYAIGAFGQWAWHYLEIPAPRGRVWAILRILLFVALAYLVVTGLWQHVGWQNDVRDEFGMERISPMVWLVIVPVAALTATSILIVVRAFRRLFHFIVRWLDKALPGRLARFIGGIALTLVIWGLWSGVLVNGFFTLANQTFAPRDSSTDEGALPPASPLRSGSPESLVAWNTLGRQGRNFVAGGPTIEELNSFHGVGAMESIRVYAGIKSAETVVERAQLVLDELIRTDAFDRKTLVVATTTGTGFLEPNAMTALEYVTNGDVAIVGVQYSYLPSWISLLADQEEVRITSQQVFDTIHGYWSTLPVDERPKIYIYGLSLGSFGVESILTSVDIVNEPIDGAFMVGPPFVNELWNQIVAGRDAGSSPSTPIYEGGRTVRFTNRESAVHLPTSQWGETKVLYLQHASDPVVFFSPSLFFTRPDWLLDGQRGEELVDEFVWVPGVTMWQVLFDMALAATVPEGYGHEYSKQSNAEGWLAVLGREGWTESDTDRLVQMMVELGPAD